MKCNSVTLTYLSGQNAGPVLYHCLGRIYIPGVRRNKALFCNVPIQCVGANASWSTHLNYTPAYSSKADRQHWLNHFPAVGDRGWTPAQPNPEEHTAESHSTLQCEEAEDSGSRSQAAADTCGEVRNTRGNEDRAKRQTENCVAHVWRKPLEEIFNYSDRQDQPAGLLSCDLCG